METETENLKKVHGVNGFGASGKFQLEIYLDAGRELTEQDQRVIWDAAELLQKGIMQESYRLNKKEEAFGKEATEKLIGLFTGRDIFVQEIPNEYWNEDVHNPWLIVTTKKGHIKIGWRKRVIVIDWSASIIEAESDTLFPDEDVTKGEKYIHAWGYEKAQEYIDKILK